MGDKNINTWATATIECICRKKNIIYLLFRNRIFWWTNEENICKIIWREFKQISVITCLAVFQCIISTRHSKEIKSITRAVLAKRRSHLPSTKRIANERIYAAGLHRETRRISIKSIWGNHEFIQQELLSKLFSSPKLRCDPTKRLIYAPFKFRRRAWGELSLL